MHMSDPFRFDKEVPENASQPWPRSALAAAAILVAILAMVLSFVLGSYGGLPDCGDGASACVTDVTPG